MFLSELGFFLKKNRLFFDEIADQPAGHWANSGFATGRLDRNLDFFAFSFEELHPCFRKLGIINSVFIEDGKLPRDEASIFAMFSHGHKLVDCFPHGAHLSFRDDFSSGKKGNLLPHFHERPEWPNRSITLIREMVMPRPAFMNSYGHVFLLGVKIGPFQGHVCRQVPV